MFSDAPSHPSAPSNPATPATSSRATADTGERTSEADRCFRGRHHISGAEPSHSEEVQERDREVRGLIKVVVT